MWWRSRGSVPVAWGNLTCNVDCGMSSCELQVAARRDLTGGRWAFVACWCPATWQEDRQGHQESPDAAGDQSDRDIPQPNARKEAGDDKGGRAVLANTRIAHRGPSGPRLYQGHIFDFLKMGLESRIPGDFFGVEL